MQEASALDTSITQNESLYNPLKEKSELFARLDEMKKAIDSYKDYK